MMAPRLGDFRRADHFDAERCARRELLFARRAHDQVGKIDRGGAEHRLHARRLEDADRDELRHRPVPQRADFEPLIAGRDVDETEASSRIRHGKARRRADGDARARDARAPFRRDHAFHRAADPLLGGRSAASREKPCDCGTAPKEPCSRSRIPACHDFPPP